jgi:galactokinase
VSLDDLEAAKEHLDATDAKRASHVVAEIGRPVAMAAALREGDLVQAGRLMKESHLSLRDLYEVSCEELDLVTALARRQPSCYGARMTGAGFGGCTVNLVHADALDSFGEQVIEAYRARAGLPAEMYVCRAVDGLRIVEF